MKVSAILAIGKELEIGLNGGLPWNSPADMRHFKYITTGHCILMGLNTYKSIGKPLPNRTNIVVSFNPFEINGCICLHSVEDGIEYAKKQNENELFIIGGASIYKYCSEKQLLDRIYLTTMLY